MEILNKNDNIAIIGAGISGLVAAYELKKKGYRNITVFEREDRVGGKLYSIEYDNKSYELGAIFGLPSQKNLKSLMDELNIKGDGPSLSRASYNIHGERTEEIDREDLDLFLKELERLPKALGQYKSLRNARMDNIEEDLKLPFSKWCEIYDFHILKDVYVHYFTIFGLGDLSEMPAIYVFKILNYENFMSFMQIPKFTTWKEGVSVITDSLAKELEDIRLSQRLIDIRPNESGDRLVLRTKYERLEYDQLIITAPLDQFKHLDLWNEKTKKYLSHIKYQDFNVYGVIVDKAPKGCGCLLENLSKDRWGHTMIWDARWTKFQTKGLVMFYAYTPLKSETMLPLDIIKDDLYKLGVEECRLYQAKRWRHYPYVDSETLMDGFYEELESIQGLNNIYLAGEIMGALSIENCIKYSRDLIGRFF